MRVRIGCSWCAWTGGGLGPAGGRPPCRSEEIFVHPPDDARIMMRWWWFGPSVTKPELEREMRAMKEGGIGGLEVQATLPAGPRRSRHGLPQLPYLSPEFLDALTFTGQKAKELGLRMDLTLCSGWPYGGPHIPIDQAAGRLRVDRVAPTNATVTPPKLADGEKLIAVFVDGRAAVADPERPVDVRATAEHLSVLHRQPHAHDGEAAGGGRRRFRARSLRPRGASTHT